MEALLASVAVLLAMAATEATRELLEPTPMLPQMTLLVCLDPVAVLLAMAALPQMLETH
jgi:hypothetical protein